MWNFKIQGGLAVTHLQSLFRPVMSYYLGNTRKERNPTKCRLNLPPDGKSSSNLDTESGKIAMSKFSTVA